MSEQVVTLQMKLDNISDSEMQDILVNLDEMKKCLLVEDENRFNIKNFYMVYCSFAYKSGDVTSSKIHLRISFFRVLASFLF